MWFEKYGWITIGLISAILTFYFKITPDDIGNFKEVLGATINIGAIGVGFLISSLSLIVSQSDKDVIKTMKKLNYSENKYYYDVLVDIMERTIKIFLLMTIFSASTLILDNNIINEYGRYIVSVLSLLAISSIFSIYTVVTVFLKIVRSL